MANIAERIIEAIRAERLVDGTGTSDDRAYNQGIADALAAAHEVAAEPDPQRELAEWLVSLDDCRDLGTVERRTAAMGEAIARAREALGRKEG